MRVLGIRDLGLTAEANVAHCDAVCRVDVCADYDRSVVVENFVGSQDITGRADFATPDPVLGDSEQEQEVFHHAYGSCRREDREDMEAERRGELETGQDEDLAHQLTVLGKKLNFGLGDPAELLEIDKVFQLMLDTDPACDRVVISKSNDIQALVRGGPQNVDRSDAWFLVIDRAGGVDMQISPVPLQLWGGFGRCRYVLGRTSSRTRTAASSWLANGNLLSGGSASQMADKWPKSANSARSLYSCYHSELP